MAGCAQGRAVVTAVVAVVIVLVGVEGCAKLPQAATPTTPTFNPVLSVPRPDIPRQALPQPAQPFQVTGDFCTDLRGLQSAPASASNDPAAAFRTLDALKSEAPPELQDVFDQITTAIAALGTTDVTDQAGVQRALALLSDPEFQSGMGRLDAYARSTCGVDLGNDLGGVAGGAPAGPGPVVGG